MFRVIAGDVPLRDDREAMALPLVSLAKRKRTAPIEWRSPDGARYVQVTANATYGMATIWDLDVLLWAVSQLNEAVERKTPTARTLRCHPHDLLRAIGRGSSGQDYRELEAALDRLTSTTIKTNARTGAGSRADTFHLVEQATHERDESGRSKALQVTVPEWVYAGVIQDREVLAISPTYFEIRSGIARWLYRLVRRQAGTQEAGWSWTFRHLHARSGSAQPLNQFSRDLRKVITANELPEYRLTEIQGQDGGPVLHAVRDPERIGLPQRRTLRRVELGAAEEPGG
jgi:plasmid replication initiation protein